MAIIRLRSTFSILAVFAALTPSIAVADSLPELWKRPVQSTYDSAKSSLALEHCIGSAVSDWGFPSILHGEGVTDLWSGKPYAIRIEDQGQSRKVSFTATAAYDDRVAKAIGGCL
ncbi:hypothetical protein ACXY7D_09365 [Sphingomonas melonis]